MSFLSQHIEALIFCAQRPIKLKEIQDCLSEMLEADVPKEHIKESIEILQTKFTEETNSFEIIKIGGGYQFLTKPAFQASISILLKQQSKKDFQLQP